MGDENRMVVRSVLNRSLNPDDIPVYAFVNGSNEEYENDIWALLDKADERSYYEGKAVYFG